MKVCIIGAGLSGLSCALTLEKYGIMPDIYEQFDRCGGRVTFITTLLQIMNRPIKDPLTDLARRYGISITPINILNRMVMFTPCNMGTARGFLGYIFERGPSPRALDSQLTRKLSAQIKYSTVADFKELSQKYDRVVVATGSPYIAKEMGCWTDVFRGWVRGALVEGEFDPTTWITWFNKSYANNGYAYLGPVNSRNASLVLIASDIREDEAESRWKKFLSTEKIRCIEKDSFLLEHIAGICQPKEVGNILLVGNAGGFMESFLGFGIYNAIASGVLAAQAIYEKTSYQAKMSYLDKTIHQSIPIRRALNMIGNSGYDSLLGLIKIPLLNNLIYNTNINFLELEASALSLVEPLLKK
ncbi:MAG: NAD(P)/FAD-dependent oxidoreductase [Bacillota bacterium]